MNLIDFDDISNIGEETSGIPHTMWIISDFTPTNIPVVGVSNISGTLAVHDDIFFIDINTPSTIYGQSKIQISDLTSIQAWIMHNKTLLLDCWKFEISTGEFLEKVYAS